MDGGECPGTSSRQAIELRVLGLSRLNRGLSASAHRTRFHRPTSCIHVTYTPCATCYCTKVTYPNFPPRAMMTLRPRLTDPEVNSIMPQKFMDVLMLGRCSHEFSWPRRGADGEYYQVCLLCAAEYKYDWATMRRTDRVEHAKPETSAPSKRRTHARKPTWVPRARRIKMNAPVRYRVKNLGTWSEGTIENLSQSGVLLLGPQRFP